jgi:hypothetical protein
MAMRYKSKDETIGMCKCLRMYRKIKTSEKGTIRNYSECGLCRNRKKEFGMLEPLEQKKVLKIESFEIKSEKYLQNIKLKEQQQEKRDTKPIKNIEIEREQTTAGTIKTTKKSVISRPENIEEKTGTNTMKTKEEAIKQIEKKDLPLSGEVVSEEIPSMDILNLSKSLRKENSSSINLLSESSTLLMKSAKGLLGDYTGDFGDEPIRKPTFTEAEMALKLALGSNELLKTKLDYIRTGKVLIDDIRRD